MKCPPLSRQNPVKSGHRRTRPFTADKQIYTQAIKDYFDGKPNTRELIKYSKALGVEDRVRAYMDVLL